jgi:8-amino-7-oxononanoate synthase
MVGTFGKAFGAFGAFAIGPPPFRALIENLARAWIFTTAPPEDATARALAHFRRVVDDDALRARLAEVALRLRTGLRQEGFTVRGEHHVLGVMLGDRAGDVAARLRRAGVWAPPIRWPTVPKGEERIRLGASAAMSDELVDRIVTAFGKPPPG